MNFSAEELRRLWLGLYRDEVARLAQARAAAYPGDLHDLAARHADFHLRRFSTPTMPPSPTAATCSADQADPVGKR